MKYYSLNHISPKATFAEATLKGQAPDKGLYFPETIPQLPKGFVDNLKAYSKEEIGFIVMKPFVHESIEDSTLQQIVNETVNFDFPLVKLTENIFSLELFHGPTLAFKDVGARFMSRCLGYFNRNNNNQTTVLVATSGDTGGAVANGFHGVKGVEVVILYPSKKVSAIQELQLTTNAENITAIEVEGNFDDCQEMVKLAFSDDDLNKKLSLTSANSINIARWLPQQLYYFFAAQQWEQEGAAIFSVPSGNFGNICSGILACKSGLPVKHFIAACNTNDIVTQFLKTGRYIPKQATATVSNAMDVGNPSNFVRMMELFEQKVENFKSFISSVSIDDATTKTTITNAFKKYNYILDPHGAISFWALEKYLETAPESKGIFLETAHPSKFLETVEYAINAKLPIPESVKYLFNKEHKSIQMEANFLSLKEWMMNK